MKDQGKNALVSAGTALLHAATLQARMARQPEKPQLKDAGYKALLAESRRCLAEVDPVEDPQKFLAVKMALETLEAAERGESDLCGVTLFKSFVEGVHGGERKISLGGRPRAGRKPSSDQAFLRAAAVALWERDPSKNRDQLVSHARTLIGVGTKQKLQKLVENFNQRHDVNIASSGSPMSIHMPLVEDLIKHHGYQMLTDFA